MDELVRRARAAVALEVAGCRDRLEPHVADLAADQVRVLQIADAKCQVETFFNRIDLETRYPHVELHRGMDLLKARNKTPDRRDDQRLRQSYSQQPLRLFARRGGKRGGLPGDVFEVLAIEIKALACLGQTQTVRRAIHELHVERFFEYRYVPADHRLRQIQPRRRLGEAARLHDRREARHQVEQVGWRLKVGRQVCAEMGSICPGYQIFIQQAQ